MTININATSLKNQMNLASPGVLADMLRAIAIGSVVRALPTTLRNKSPNAAPADPYVHSTLQALALPDDAKANNIFRAFARSAAGGGATPLELAVQSYGTTPSTGQVAVAPNGDIVFLASDAWTSVDVVYLPEKCDVVELTLAVATNACTLPTALGPYVILMEAEGLVGTTTGKKEVLVPSASTASAGTARMDLAHAVVKFNGTDAITSARVKLGVVSAIDVDELLTASSADI